MIVDSSALLTIMFQEPDALKFAMCLRDAPILKIAAPSFLEACMASTRRFGSVGAAEVRGLVTFAKIEIIPFEEDAAQLAVDAFLKYGKGQGHPAQLNFGDCIAYATAKIEAMPLLFKGDDFRLTDVACAI